MATSRKKKAMIAASIAGMMAVAGSAVFPPAAYAAGVPCYGINACQGKGDCGGKGHSCAGKNACKGKGYVSLPDKETCLKINGGSLEPAAA